MDEGRAVAGAIDTHVHLNHPRLMRRLPEVLARAREAGVSEMIVVGYDVPSSRRAVELAEGHRQLWAAVGVHPHDAAGFDEESVAALRALARADKVVAVGETGLDFYRDLSPRTAQQEAFERHLALAAEFDLPVIVHCRDAQDSVLEALGSWARPGVVWHCFDGTAEQAKRALALGLVLGFGGPLTYRKAEDLHRVATDAPGERILLETDCPYLAPEGRRNRDNEPANVVMIAESLAALRGESRAQVEQMTAENARRVFRLRRKGA